VLFVLVFVFFVSAFQVFLLSLHVRCLFLRGVCWGRVVAVLVFFKWASKALRRVILVFFLGEAHTTPIFGFLLPWGSITSSRSMCQCPVGGCWTVPSNAVSPPWRGWSTTAFCFRPFPFLFYRDWCHFTPPRLVFSRLHNLVCDFCSWLHDALWKSKKLFRRQLSECAFFPPSGPHFDCFCFYVCVFVFGRTVVLLAVLRGCCCADGAS